MHAAVLGAVVVVLAIFLPQGVLGGLRRVAGVKPLLQVEVLGVRFAGLQALADVSMQAHPGEVIGLIGPNGAGKTTFINAVSGAVPYRGRVTFGGRGTGRAETVSDRAPASLARTYQIVQPFPEMTVLDNVAAGALFVACRAILAAVLAPGPKTVLERVGLALERKPVGRRRI